MSRSTILDAVKEANDNAKLPDFTFAMIDEFSRFLDSFKATDTPIHVIVPFEEQGTWGQAGLRKATCPIEGWVLTFVSEESMDYRSPQAEIKYIQPMRLKCKKFLRELVNTDIVDDDVRDIRDVITPEYGFLNARLFGVHYRIQLPIVEGIC